jgi:hypothetical protein
MVEGATVQRDHVQGDAKLGIPACRAFRIALSISWIAHISRRQLVELIAELFGCPTCDLKGGALCADFLVLVRLSLCRDTGKRALRPTIRRTRSHGCSC